MTKMKNKNEVVKMLTKLISDENTAYSSYNGILDDGDLTQDMRETLSAIRSDEWRHKEVLKIMRDEIQVKTPPLKVCPECGAVLNRERCEDYCHQLYWVCPNPKCDYEDLCSCAASEREMMDQMGEPKGKDD